VGFSVVTWGLALVKGVQFARQKRQDRQFQKQFWSATSLDSAGVAQAGFAAIQVQDNGQPDLAQSINHQDRLERALRQQIQRERR
ncbi:MotA/TolQ/ExbB proton channel family protein, partial [Pseudomonas aeruginosa]|nr:MotA/TolQ/ExbB proton channel family protein [Pseudomonas aeruginosa]